VTVYVDEAVHPSGRMKMCHMIADTKAELLLMADAIGADRKWIQKDGTTHEHFDIAKSKREFAVCFGAQELTRKELGRTLRARRNEGT